MNIINYLRIKAAALPGRAMNADPTLRAGIDKAYADISQPQYPQAQRVPVQQQRVTQQPIQQPQPVQQQPVPTQQPVQQQQPVRATASTPTTTTTTAPTPEPAAQPEPVAEPAPSTNTATPPSAVAPSTLNPTPTAPGYRKIVGGLSKPAVKQTLQKGNVGTGHPLYEKAVSDMQQQIADTEKRLASLPQTDRKRISDLKKILRLRKNKLLTIQKYGITPVGENDYDWGGYLDGDEAYSE